VSKSFDLHSILDTASKITLPGGVVGKVCKVLIFIALAFAAIAWSVKVVWVSVAALGMLFLLCFVILWRLVSFADRNPQAAILEGAEFLMHEQLRLGTKANPQLPAGEEDLIEATPVTLSPEERETIQEPDSDTPQLPESEDGGEEVHHG
jgi:hypothetical protein